MNGFKFFLYFYVKYLLFYVVHFFLNFDIKFFNVRSVNTVKDVFYYLLIFMPLPVVNSVLFYFGIKFIFKSKKYFYLIPYLILEYLIYVYLTSQKLWDINGLVNMLVSCFVLLIIALLPSARARL